MDVFKRIDELIENGESFVSAVIVARSGSAPRTAGARMLVRRDASITGTIGGGILEAQARDLAMKVFGDGKSVLKKFSFTAEEAARECMICGGEVEVLIHFADFSQSLNQVLYRQIAETFRSGKRAWLITEIPPGGGEPGPPAQGLVKKDGAYAGRLDRSIARALVNRSGTGRAALVSHDRNLFFVEPLCDGGTVLIFGAGHISRKLAPLARLVGFRTVVLDDRREFANREHFESADAIMVPDSFERVVDDLGIDEDSYLVLVTRGHAHDKTLLRQALGTKAAYIGMIGSIRKRDSVYEALRSEGFSAHAFDRVCSPIGLDIGAETPEEIAVSIVAELIRARAGKNLISSCAHTDKIRYLNPIKGAGGF
jgi:xanthine dehydrogenase accessory factor